MLNGGLTTFYLRIDFGTQGDKFSIRDEAYDAETSGPSDQIIQVIEHFLNILTTRMIETAHLPTYQKNLKERSFKAFQ